jgi:predicted amidohydrolase YtcJ
MKRTRAFRPWRSKIESSWPWATTNSVLALRGSNTRVIDLKGQFAVPGFSDNHVHFPSAAQFLEFNLMRVTTQEELGARVKDVRAG